MDYVGFRIRQAAEDVLTKIKRIQKDIFDYGMDHFSVARYYKDNYPDNPDLKNAKTLSDAVLLRLKAALKTLREAAIYAERVEWLTSGDDGYEEFVLRTDKDLKELESSQEERASSDD